MRLRYVFATLILGGCALAGSAQTGSTSVKVATGTQMSPVQAQEELLNLFEHEFMGVAQAMPADKYSFAPTTATFAPSQGEKYHGVRTFAQEISHVTTANYYFASKILGEKMPVDPKSIDSLTTKEELLKAAAASFAYAHKALATITAENAYTTIGGVDGLHTRSVIASFISAHGFDHYGQMVEYLRMNGIVPPGSK
ncbi:MAG TPA: DinB family protein [Terracidiphilus sp.]|nr:DinB family protein [Terracidiphilus sp.]